MNADKHRFLIGILLIMFGLSVQIYAQKTVKIKKYYQLKAGNEWRYTAPPNWKDGDYISEMKRGIPMKVGEKIYKTVLHFDATKAAKVLAYAKGKGLYYLRENFAGGQSYAVFEKPILWFPHKIEIGKEYTSESDFKKFFTDGRPLEKGTFKLKQKVTKIEDVKTAAGKFKNALSAEFETIWEFGDGTKARSENVYHYAKNVGVVKASARFIIFDKDGKELINRLVETDLKSYKVK